MNYSGFKKTHEDDDKAVLQNRHGHELSIAKKALSKKHLEELKKLPLYAYKGSDEVQDPTEGLQADTSFLPNSEPVPKSSEYIPPGSQGALDWNSINNFAGAPTISGEELKKYGSVDAAEAAKKYYEENPAAQNPFAPAQQPQAPSPASIEQPDLTSAAMPPPQPNASMPSQAAAAPPDLAQDLKQEDQDFKGALARGEITPKTYQDLFNDKNLTGKIGTLFGLIVGGAGAGLTHQPNAVMEMMKDQLNKDFEGQKASKTNALNFVRAASEYRLNKAQTGLTQAQTAVQNNALGLMLHNRAAFHSLVDQVSKMPEGADKQAKIQMLGFLSNGLDAHNFNIADIAAAKMGLVQGFGNTPAGADTKQTATHLRNLLMANAINEPQYSKANEELKMIENKQQANQGAFDSFDKVAKMTTLAGRLTNPIQAQRQIDAAWNPMLDKITKSNEGRVTPITVDMMNGFKPKIGDNNESTNVKRQKLSEVLNSGYSTPVLDGLRLSPNKSVPAEGNQPQLREGATGRDKRTGAPTIVRNGKWVPK